MARAGKTVPPWFVAELFQIKNPKEATLAGQLLEALGKISPDLVPRVLAHPLIHEIARGADAYPGLLERLGAARDDDERALVLDAVAEILTRMPPTAPVVQALEQALARTKSAAVASVAARALATARVEPFLEHQRNLLGSSQPEEVRVAARLLGFGRYARAVPVLLEILRPDNLVAADAIIWALGEIGAEPSGGVNDSSRSALLREAPGPSSAVDAAGIALLHNFLTRNLLVDVVLSALGKIGSRASVVRILPFVLEGGREHREKAAEALARIARRNDGTFGDPGLDEMVRKTLEKLLDADESRLVRFHAMVAYALLGGRLEPGRMLGALGGQLSKADLDAVGGLLTGRMTRPGSSAEATKSKKGRRPI